MRHIPVAQLKDKLSEALAAAAGGEEIVITRHGRDVAKLTGIDGDRLERQRAAINGLYALGQRIKAKHGPTTAAEIREMIEEGRK